MKGCPRCNLADAWRLGDGRYKCQSCNRRYSWRSVWDAIRLPEPAKHTLLQAFAGNVTAAANAISTTQRQRFYRLARACCALQSPVPGEAMHIYEGRAQPAARLTMRGWASAREVMILAIAEHAGTVRICLPPMSPAHVFGLLRARSALGGMLRVLDNLAYASLPVHGGYISVPRATHSVLAMHVVEDFWHHARTRLQEYRRIPLRQFPLHLGELCFRFNRRNEDLPTLVHALLQSIAMSEVRAILNATHEQSLPQAACAGMHEQGAIVAMLSTAERPHLSSGRADSVSNSASTTGTHRYE